MGKRTKVELSQSCMTRSTREVFKNLERPFDRIISEVSRDILACRENWRPDHASVVLSSRRTYPSSCRDMFELQIEPSSLTGVKGSIAF